MNLKRRFALFSSCSISLSKECRSVSFFVFISCRFNSFNFKFSSWERLLLVLTISSSCRLVKQQVIRSLIRTTQLDSFLAHGYEKPYHNHSTRCSGLPVYSYHKFRILIILWVFIKISLNVEVGMNGT